MRNQLRRARQDLSSATQRAHSLAIHQHLVHSNVFDTYSTVASYLCSDGEVDLEPVMREFHRRNLTVTVPVVVGMQMCFVRYDRDSRCRNNRWGIREPVEQIPIDPETIDLALVPLVAFSSQGTRLGRGGGYYDQFFANREDTMFIGVAHELQRVEALIQNSWDKPMDGIVTNAGWTLCSDRAKSEIETGRVHV